MLHRLFRQRDAYPKPASLAPGCDAQDCPVRADPDFDVEGDRIIARAVCIHWQENGVARKLRLQRDLRPARPQLIEGPDSCAVLLQRDGEQGKPFAQGLDRATAAALHRVIWNWTGQLCQNGHEPFPMKVAPPAGGYHDT